MSSTIRTVVVGAALLAAVPSAAQVVVMRPVPAPASAVDNYIHTVGDLDRTFAFYRDVIGLPVTAEPGEAVFEPRLQRLTSTPGSGLRAARFGLPGTGAGLLLAEFSRVDRRPWQARVTDPGVSMLVLVVRDLNAALEAVRASGTEASVVRPESPQLARVYVADPDGFPVMIVMREPAPALADEPTGNVVGARVRITVARHDPVVAFYRDVLGFSVTRTPLDRRSPLAVAPPGTWTGESDGSETGASLRFGRIPGSSFEWEFVEFRGYAQVVHEGRLQDPGTPAISVLVPDVRVAARAVREAGLPIVSAGGVPAMSDTGGAVFVRDPGGMLVELVERR